MNNDLKQTAMSLLNEVYAAMEEEPSINNVSLQYFRDIETYCVSFMTSAKKSHSLFLSGDKYDDSNIEEFRMNLEEAMRARTKDNLIKLLNEHNAWQSFSEAVKIENISGMSVLMRENTFGTVDGYLDWYFENLDPMKVIEDSFRWSATAEGHEFWERLDKEWKEGHK